MLGDIDFTEPCNERIQGDLKVKLAIEMHIINKRTGTTGGDVNSHTGNGMQIVGTVRQKEYPSI